LPPPEDAREIGDGGGGGDQYGEPVEWIDAQNLGEPCREVLGIVPAAYNGGARPSDNVEPAFSYDHSGGRCAVVGGYVHRGSALPDLVGAYVFGDFCTGQVWALRNGEATDLGITKPFLQSFGQDADGELWLLYADGTIARLITG
jgi:hypothetical protein